MSTVAEFIETKTGKTNSLNESQLKGMLACNLLAMHLEEAIKGLKEVPEGHLYAAIMGSTPLWAFELAIEILLTRGTINRASNLITWIGE